MDNIEKKKKKHLSLPITQKVKLLQKLDRGVLGGARLTNMVSEQPLCII